MVVRVVVPLLYLLIGTAVPGVPQQRQLPAAQQPAGFSPAPPPARSSAADTARLGELEAELAADHAVQAAWLNQVSLALADDPSPALQSLQQGVATIVRMRADRLATRDPSWPREQVDTLLAMLLVDPRRFAYDDTFRSNVEPILRDALPPAVPMAVRRDLLVRLNGIAGLPYAIAERTALAWGLTARLSRAREISYVAPGDSNGATGAIRASFYSLPGYLDFEAAAAFLRAVHELAPQRDLVVLSNDPLIERLRPLAGEMPLHLVDSFGRRYSMWPRDPFAVATSPSGGVLLVSRPNLQAQRESDAFMAREFIKGLPDALDEKWGQMHWTISPVPFHGGHMQATPGTIWVSVHTLLPRIKELLDVSGPLDIGELEQPEALQRFLDATNAAAAELAAVFDQDVRFVHPLPVVGAADERRAFEIVLTGGDTTDLDSYITILPGPDGVVRALVGDFSLGAEMLAEATSEQIDELAATYDLQVPASGLKSALADAHAGPRTRVFHAYLDAITAFLEEEGMEVLRLPILNVPSALLAEDLRSMPDGFLLTWNNVVIEHDNGRARAEGFQSGLATADARVRQVFDAAGYDLRYLPVLARSVMRGGGYRCASNHVR